MSQGVFATGGKVSAARGKFVAAPSNKCAKCTKSVALPEERRACKLSFIIITSIMNTDFHSFDLLFDYFLSR